MIAPRPEIEKLAPVVHGGYHSADAARLDFSSNVNPFGPSPRVWEQMRSVVIGEHPDPRAAPLREFLAARENVKVDELIVGNGSVELIYGLALAYLRAGDRVLIVAPTFGEYAAAAKIMGAEVMEFCLREQNNFALDVDTLIPRARELKPRILFLCNPNNPTGTYVSRAAILEILRACPETLVVLDEAFVKFLPDAWRSNAEMEFENLVILRSLTKDYALTGLRVGYAMGAPAIISALEKVQPPWSVNSFAQAAAMAAMCDHEFFRESLMQLERAKLELVKGLHELGLAPLDSPLNFFLLPVPSSQEWSARLLAQGIRVRDCASYGLPHLVRIATRRPQENAALLAALKLMTV